MRATTAMLGIACLFLGGCRVPPAGLSRTTPLANHDASAVVCPDGKPAQPGLTNFGAYIGTWQAGHRPDPTSPSDYAIDLATGRITVQCSAAGFVTVEIISLTFQVPNGRALQFALTDLPADSTKIYDHTHPGCQNFQYRSHRLAQQLAGVDSEGLADITLASPSATYNRTAVSLVRIEVAGTVGDDSRGCNQAPAAGV
jgi:hypothetical protein